LSELPSIRELPPLDEVDADPDPLPDEDEPEPLPDPPPVEEDEEGEGLLEPPVLDAPPEVPLLELGPAAAPPPLPALPVEDADVASIAPPSSVEMPLAPVVPTFPPQAASPSWPRAVTATQARIA